MTNVTLIANTDEPVSFSLPDWGEGVYHVYLQYATTNGSAHSEIVGRTVVLDRIAPLVDLTAPSTNATLDQAFMMLEAVAFDWAASSTNSPDPSIPLKIWINDQPYWERAGTNISISRFILPTDTNSFTVKIRVEDSAGNSNQVMRTWVIDGSGDTIAPQLTNFNIAATLLLPDVAEMWIEGDVDDENAMVAAIVSSGGGFTQTNALNVRGLRVEGLVPLAFGTNQVLLNASDAAGNTTSNLFTIVRSGRYRAAITSPALGAFATAPSNLVSGYVSALFDEALPSETNVAGVVINGQEAVLDWESIDENGNVPFLSAQYVVVGEPITGEVVGDGIPTEPPPSIPPAPSQEYEVIHKETFMEDFVPSEGEGVPSGNLDREAGETCWTSGMIRDLYWRTADVPSGSDEVQVDETFHIGLLDDGDPICVTTLNPDHLPWVYPEDPWILSGNEPGPESHALSFGLYSYIHGAGLRKHLIWDFQSTNPCNYEWHTTEEAYLERHRDDGWLQFVAPRHYGTNQHVVLTFEGTDYRRCEGKPLDLSKVKFRGQDPVAYSNEVGSVSYEFTVHGGREYTIGADNFEWPSDYEGNHYAEAHANTQPCVVFKASSLVGTWTEEMHWLSWTNFHNLSVRIVKTDPDISILCPGCTMQFYAETDPPGRAVVWSIKPGSDETGAASINQQGLLSIGANASRGNLVVKVADAQLPQVYDERSIFVFVAPSNSPRIREKGGPTMSPAAYDWVKRNRRIASNAADINDKGHRAADTHFVNPAASASGRWDGPWGAFLHAYGNCVLARIARRSFPSTDGTTYAKEFYDAYEEYTGNTCFDAAMDYHNNEIGRKLSLLPCSGSEDPYICCDGLAYAAYLDALLRWNDQEQQTPATCPNIVSK